MRDSKIVCAALNLENTVILELDEEDGAVIVSVRPYKREQLRCPICGAKCDPYDSDPQTKFWRTPDIGFSKSYLKYAACRVNCPEHGVHEEALPWASEDSRFTHAFEDWIDSLPKNFK